MKIIRVDNFNREDRPEYLAAANIQSEEEANIMLTALQAACSNNSPQWYQLVPDDHRLWRGMEDLVGNEDPVVYVVQSPPMVVDHETGNRRPKYSLANAERFGRLEYLVPNENWTHGGDSTQALLALLRERLANYHSGDYLLLIGAPHVIALAATVASRALAHDGGEMKLLIWQRMREEYEVVEVRL